LRLLKKITVIKQKYKKYNKSYSFYKRFEPQRYMYDAGIYNYIVCKDAKRLNLEQIDIFLRFLTNFKSHFVKKIFKKLKFQTPIFFNGHFHGIFTKKPIGVRMGKGKGNNFYFCCGNKSGSIILDFYFFFSLYFFKHKFDSAIKFLPSKNFELFNL